MKGFRRKILAMKKKLTDNGKTRNVADTYRKLAKGLTDGVNKGELQGRK